MNHGGRWGSGAQRLEDIAPAHHRDSRTIARSQRRLPSGSAVLVQAGSRDSVEPTLQTCQHQQRRRRAKTATMDDGRARYGLLGIGLTGRARSLPVKIRPPMPVPPQNHTKRMNDCTHDLSISRTERNIFTTLCVLPARRCAASAPWGTKNGATWAGVRPSSTLLVRREKPEREFFVREVGRRPSTALPARR